MYMKALELLLADKTLKTVEFIESKTFTIKVTRRFKAIKIRNTNKYHEDLVVTIGRPGYLTRAFIKKNPLALFRTKKFPIKKKKKENK